MEEKIEVLQLLKVINKWKLIIILGTVVCLLLGVVATALMTPEYEASARMLVTQGQSSSTNQPIIESYQAVLLSQQLTKTLSEMIKGRTLSQKVIGELGLSMTPEELERKIDSKSVRDTQLIDLTVTDVNPTLAKRIANTIATDFAKMTTEVIPPNALISVKIIEPAVVPFSPVKPKPLMNVSLAVLLGLVISIALAFLLETLDSRVNDSEDIEQLTSLTSLGRIPVMGSQLVLNGSDPASSEAYRSVRTNLQYLNFDNSIKTLLVTSASAGDGKTTVASNLAIVFAQAGFNVLLMDADLRNPNLSRLFNKRVDDGLSSFLVYAVTGRSIILNTDIDNLYLLASGPVPPNPSDLLNSYRMDKLIEDLESKFDLIIVDSPPVLGVSDTAILATKADAILLVARVGETMKSEIAATKDALDKVGARTIGFVMNGAETNGRYSNYHYYAGPRAVSNE